jgi:coproporphyrinogen III oxidase-like Fe-S oxidoreductase
LALHGLDPRQHFAAPIASMVQRGWLQVDGDLLRLTTAGVLFADEVGACFL